MKTKYYLRGIGIGLLTATIILSVSFWKMPAKELSDQEIVERAKELGMVMGEDSETKDSEYKSINDLISEADNKDGEDTRSDDGQEDENNQPSDSEQEEGGDQPSDSEQEEGGDQPSDSGQEEDGDEASDSGQEENDDQSSDDSQEEKKTEYVTIRINGGDVSETVARKLAEAGLVKSASEYNRYLVSKGYDSRLLPGVYEIPKGADKAEIAKIITGR